MDETTTNTPTEWLETPVLDNSLFLLHERNRDFLNGKRAAPILKNRSSGSDFVQSMFLIVVLLGLCQLINWVRNRIPSIDIDLPPLPTAWIGDPSFVFILFGVLAVIGLLVVLYDMRGMRRQGAGPQKPTPVKTAAVPVVAERPIVPTAVKGQILTGEVVQAEKIRHRSRHSTIEKVGVRYRFAAPGGVTMEGKAEGDIISASHDMAPTLGTPVRVWYTDNDRFYLL